MFPLGFRNRVNSNLVGNDALSKLEKSLALANTLPKYKPDDKETLELLSPEYHIEADSRALLESYQPLSGGVHKQLDLLI